jgi:uncharacterized protein
LEIEAAKLNSESSTLKQWLIPRNNEAELAAFEAVCERLMGFEAGLSFEWIDGFLTGLAAAPRVPEASAWVPAMLGDTFERVFADPADQAQAVAAMQARLKVLCRQLDPEALFDDHETLRLEPLMESWEPADAQQVEVMAGEMRQASDLAPAPEGVPDDALLNAASLLQTGALWANAFMASTLAFPENWQAPTDGETAALFDEAMNHVGALTFQPTSPELAQHLNTYYPPSVDKPDEAAVSRDDLIAQALWSVQDLRMYWVEFAPKPTTIHVETKPGRNDPCHCGSGKKFKKCHGA